VRDIVNVNPPAIIKPAEDLAALATAINAAHQEAEGCARASLEHARRCGQLLLQAKAACGGHGRWLPWLRGHCNVSERTAQAYMRVAKRWDDLEAKAQGLADLTFEDALGLLAEAGPESKTAYVERGEDSGLPEPKTVYVERGPEPPPKPPTVVYQAEERPTPAESRERKGGRRRRRFFHLPKPLRAILGEHEVTRRERTMLALGRLGDTALGRQVARMLAGDEHKAVREAVQHLAEEAARRREASATGPAADARDHGDDGGEGDTTAVFS
jgi:hypothetical protein